MRISRTAALLVLGVFCGLGSAAALRDEDRTVEFTVASYNVHGIFFPDFSGCPFGTRRYRFSRIADVTNRYDVMLLQEFFRSKCRGDAFRGYLLEPSNHPYQRYHDQQNRTIYDSGLGAFVGPRLSEAASSWHVTEYDGFNGTHPLCAGRFFRGNDCFSTKGFGRLVIEIFGHELVIYLTHLDSSNTSKDRRVRIGQLKQLAAAVMLDKNAGRAILLAGDFNIVAGTDKADSLALEVLRCSLALTEARPVDGPDPREQCGDWSRCNEKSIDHMFYRSGDHLELEVVDVRWQKLRGGPLCSSLSDHPMLVATIRATPRVLEPRAGGPQSFPRHCGERRVSENARRLRSGANGFDFNLKAIHVPRPTPPVGR